ncbi:hypothetical protein ACFX14_032259 [Malus domestica]
MAVPGRGNDASQRGDLDALRLALDNLVGSIDDSVEDGDTALHLACLYGNLSCVRVSHLLSMWFCFHFVE